MQIRTLILIHKNYYHKARGKCLECHKSMLCYAKPYCKRTGFAQFVANLIHLGSKSEILDLETQIKKSEVLTSNSIYSTNHRHIHRDLTASRDSWSCVSLPVTSLASPGWALLTHSLLARVKRSGLRGDKAGKAQSCCTRLLRNVTPPIYNRETQEWNNCKWEKRKVIWEITSENSKSKSWWTYLWLSLNMKCLMSLLIYFTNRMKIIWTKS